MQSGDYLSILGDGILGGMSPELPGEPEFIPYLDQPVSERPKLMPFAWELFCAEVASGTTQVESATLAGFAPDYATQLMRKPEIQARINELVLVRQRDSGVVSRVWAELQLIRIARGALEGVPAVVDANDKILQPAIQRDWPLAMSAVMNFCKLKGYIVERKLNATAKMDLGAVGKAEMNAMLAEHLQDLAPADRARIKAIASGKARVVDAE